MRPTAKGAPGTFAGRPLATSEPPVAYFRTYILRVVLMPLTLSCMK
jgi:hypothetical protein